jgi:hypothetical protein
MLVLEFYLAQSSLFFKGRVVYFSAKNVPLRKGT